VLSPPAHITSLVSDRRFTEAIPEKLAASIPRDAHKPLPNGTVVDGTGAGSGSVVRFTAGAWVGVGVDSRVHPEDVLFHEMWHSLRQMLGLNKQTLLTGAEAVFGDEEEFLAVLVANVFASEKGRPSLRGSYSLNFVELADQNPGAFYAAHSQLIDRLGVDPFMRSLFIDLSALVDIPFNPFVAWRTATVNHLLAV
jgi:hypothetical protein